MAECLVPQAEQRRRPIVFRFAFAFALASRNTPQYMSFWRSKLNAGITPAVLERGEWIPRDAENRVFNNIGDNHAACDCGGEKE